MNLSAKDQAALDEIESRTTAFYLLCEKLRGKGVPWEPFNYYPCPVCGYPTIVDPYNYDGCILCDWEDGGYVDGTIEEENGANGGYSVLKAKLNFARYGCMYDPEDTFQFNKEQKKSDYKLVLIHLYERLLNIKNSKKFSEIIIGIERHIGAWNTWTGGNPGPDR